MLPRMGTHAISQPCGQFDGEHHRGLRHLHPPAGRRLIDIPARLPGRHREPARQHTRRLGGRDPRSSQVSRSVDALSVLRCWRAAARHDTTILPDLSPVVSGAPGLFQPPVTQRDIKAEVANFVGGVISPLLSSIYLHKLDVFVEQVLIPEYTRGKRRRHNPEYHKLSGVIERGRKRGDREAVREARR